MLQKCYGSPEVVEKALFKRLDSFPHLSADNIKLRELSDLLMELLAAKNDGCFPGLMYLDTPHGIKPIVEKLPPGLQEKWLTTGSRFKEQNSVIFLLLSSFVDFIYREAKAQNEMKFHPDKQQPASQQEWENSVQAKWIQDCYICAQDRCICPQWRKHHEICRHWEERLWSSSILALRTRKHTLWKNADHLQQRHYRKEKTSWENINAALSAAPQTISLRIVRSLWSAVSANDTALQCTLTFISLLPFLHHLLNQMQEHNAALPSK